MNKVLAEMMRQEGVAITGSEPDVRMPNGGESDALTAFFRYTYTVTMDAKQYGRGVETYLLRMRSASEDVIKLMNHTIEKINTRLGELT